MSFDEFINREGTRSIKLDFRERLFGRKDVIPLWVADMDFAVPQAVQKVMQHRLDHPIYGYSHLPPSFYEAIQKWLLRRFNWETDRSWIEYSPGVVPNLGFAVQALTKIGEGVIIQPPVYPPFFGVIRNSGRNIVENPLKETKDGYEIDFDHFEQLASRPENRLLLLCHPHNPVGRVWTKEELLQLGDLCLRNNITVVSDEIHADLVLYDNKHIPFASLSEELANITISCMAPSKTFNLAGLNTSYMIVPNEELLNAVKSQIQSLHLNMGNVFGGLALETAYNECEGWLEEVISYLEVNCDLVIQYINDFLPEVKITKPEATYLLWLDFRAWNMTTTQLKDFMVNKAGLGLNDGFTYGKEGRGFMRMNIASSRSLLDKALHQLKEARKSL